MIPGPGRWTLLLALLLMFVWVFTAAVLMPWTVAGESMLPRLRPGDRVLVDLWTYRQRLPRAGEIALVAGPSGEPLVKRVSRLTPAPSGVGSPGVWILGDNAGDSRDSRHFGAVPSSRVRGRVVLVFWPPSRAGWVGSVAGSARHVRTLSPPAR